MKKIIMIALAALVFALPANAQTKSRTGYVNTETILASVPEYKVATEKLEALSKKYNDEVSAELKKAETLYNNYQKQKNSLSAQQRQARENEIITKEQTVKKLRQSYFGEEGVMEKKRAGLLCPIRDRVQKAIDKVAADVNYMIIFDISALQGVVYADSASDLSNLVIKALR